MTLGALLLALLLAVLLLPLLMFLFARRPGEPGDLRKRIVDWAFPGRSLGWRYLRLSMHSYSRAGRDTFSWHLRVGHLEFDLPGFAVYHRHAPGALRRVWPIACLLLTLALSAAAQTPAPSPEPVTVAPGFDGTQQPTVSIGTWTGVLGYVAPEGKREVLFGRVAVNVRAAKWLHVAGQINMQRTQDGGSIQTVVLPVVGDVPDPRSFRDLDVRLAAYLPLLPIDNVVCGPAAVLGVTFSIEGADGPQEPRQWMHAAGVRCGDHSGGHYAYALWAWRYDAAAGPHLVGGAQIRLHGPVSAIAEGLPFGDHRFALLGVVVGRQSGQ